MIFAVVNRQQCVLAIQKHVSCLKDILSHVQDHMRGGVDDLVVDCVDMMFGPEYRKNRGTISRPRMLPDFLLQLASQVSPF